MVQFNEIVSKTLRASYTREDGGYKVVGNASYDKNNKMIDAYGEISDADGLLVARFSAYGADEKGGMRTNLNDVDSSRMTAAVMVVEATLAGLQLGYTEA